MSPQAIALNSSAGNMPSQSVTLPLTDGGFSSQLLYPDAQVKQPIFVPTPNLASHANMSVPYFNYQPNPNIL